MGSKSTNIGGQGGARQGSGPKKKAKNSEPPALSQIKVTDIFGEGMPEPGDFLSSTQSGGQPELTATAIYTRVWDWLCAVECASAVYPEVIERYAMFYARWIQIEELISSEGFLGEHPTTGGVIATPYINMSMNYANQAARAWGEIYQIVKENCTGKNGTVQSQLAPQQDEMENILKFTAAR